MYARSIILTTFSTRARVSHGGFGSRPEKYMLYSASSCRRSASSRCSSCSMDAAIPLSRDEQPDERQPQFARERDRSIVDEHVGGVGRTDDLEQIAQPRGVARPEPRPVAVRGTAAHLAELGRRARDLERAREAE